MMTFRLEELTERQQADFKADGRIRAFLSMKKAFKKRSKESGVTIQSLSKAIGRDKAQISRIISGRSTGVTLDTLVLITSALGFRMSFDVLPVEEMRKRNRNVAPLVTTAPINLKENVQGSAIYVGGTSQANTASTPLMITGSKA